MKFQLLLISLLAIGGLYLFNQDIQTLPIEQDSNFNVYQAYQVWKQKYNKNYNSGDEAYRFTQFQKNYEFVQEHNNSGDQLVLDTNEFADMSNDEFNQKYLTLKKRPYTPNDSVPTITGVEIDWVQKGAVMPTTNQANCGSCWAFSSIAGLQGLRFLTEGVLERLSAQQLVSCIPFEDLDKGAEDGCGGSEPHFAYNYTNVQGIETWNNYPYVSGLEGVVPPCHHQKSDSVFYNDGPNHGFVRIDSGDVPSIKEAIQKRPLSIDMNAGNIYFQLYKDGIIKNEKCKTALTHAIIMVGMNDNLPTPYYKVQNSWGPGWGQDGYGKVAITEGDGVCGINKQVEYPTTANFP